MWKNLLLVGILAVVVCTLRCLTRQRRKEKGIPIFSVKARQHVILSQPVLQTTPVFTYEHGEQDRILIKKYYHGRTVTAGYRKFRIDRVKKIPRENWRNTCYYRMYFQEYLGKELPCRIQIVGHVRYWKYLCKKNEVVLYDHVGGVRRLEYEDVAVIIQKKRMVIGTLPARRRLTVFDTHNFYGNDFQLLKELLIKYGKLGVGRDKNS